MRERLKEILLRSKQIKVLVVGDLMLDRYIWGTVDRISPEAPIQILEFASENMAPGGAANVANNLKALQCQVHLCGVVGDDENGRQLFHILKEKGIDSEGVMVDPSRPTTHKVRAIAHNQQILRIDREVHRAVSHEVLTKVTSYLMQMIPEVDGIICSDYKKGLMVDELLRTVIDSGHRHELRLALDPKGSDYSRYRGVDVLTPNLQEIEIASKIPIIGEEELDRAVECAFGLTESRAILVTRGKEGMTLYENGGSKTHIPADVREVYDVTGAGDTVISVFGLGLFCNADLVDAAWLANKAAGIAVGKLGTAAVSWEELARYVDEASLGFKEKIVNLDECKQALSQARSYGRRIVFTNGCFDLLHIGHIQFLQAAKRLGDVLVVGVNDDHSVRAVKGPRRPLTSEMERARILAALECVDYVILFSEHTPERLIGELRPDLLVKGRDYGLEEVAGRKIVEGYGGRVELIPLFPGSSTSGIVQTIIEKYRDNP